MAAVAGHFLDHPDLHAARLAALQFDFVHEAANQENAAAAGFQDVFGRKGIGKFLGIEAFALVFDADDEFFGIVRRHRA